LKFLHLGIPTEQKIEDKNYSYVEKIKLHVTNPEEHEYKLQFVCADPDSPLPDIVKKEKHLSIQLDDMEEAWEIQKQKPEKRFLIKPLIGSGGFGVSPISDYREDPRGPFILQEFIEGLHLSASVLSTGKDVMTILTSRQQVLYSHLL